MKNTFKGIRTDLKRAKDRLAIRIINVLDKLRGEYEAPTKNKYLHKGN